MYQGVVIINKEPDFTSFDVVAVCRKIFGQKAVGHTGTLDPMARGVLPVCLGRATKLSSMLTSTEKSYEVEMELGRTTDTDDVTGVETGRTDPSGLTEDQVRNVLTGYIGSYDQVPPRYAAIKKDGKKLYEYARAGVEVDMPGRPVTIYELEILEIRLPKVTYRVRCSKGTYIRSLCRDVGADLGVGAVMTGLLRRSTGGFSLEDAVTLDQLKAAKEEGTLEQKVLPMDVLLKDYPAVTCKPEGEKLLLNGNALPASAVTGEKLQQGQICRVYLKDTFAALYRYDAGRNMLHNEKMLLERG